MEHPKRPDGQRRPCGRVVVYRTFTSQVVTCADLSPQKNTANRVDLTPSTRLAARHCSVKTASVTREGDGPSSLG